CHVTSVIRSKPRTEFVSSFTVDEKIPKRSIDRAGNAERSEEHFRLGVLRTREVGGNYRKEEKCFWAPVLARLVSAVRWAAGLSGELRCESFARFFGSGQFVIPRSVALNLKCLAFTLGDALSENTLIVVTNFSSFLALPTFSTLEVEVAIKAFFG
ncbi:hypothetical protein K0M31_003305, partial [Melipona bicolor]